MKLDTHNFNSCHQNEDVLDVAEEILGKDPGLFNATEKTLDSSQTEVGDHDGLWQLSGFDSYHSVSSKTAESNATEVKDYDALICHPCENSGQIDEMHLFSDKTKNELEVPELVICYKENSYLDIKDICVDENMPSCERIFFEADVEKEDLCSLLLFKGRGNDLTTETIEFSDPTPDYLKFCEDLDNKSPDSRVRSEEIRQTELKVHEVAEHVLIGQILPKEQELATEIPQQKSSEDTCNEDVQVTLKELGMEEISMGPALTSADEESANISHAEESNNNILIHPEGEIPASPSEKSNHAIPACGPSDGNDLMDSSGNGNQENQVPNQNIPKVNDSREGSFRDQRSLGETSFSMAGPVSGLVTYSGPIAYSGSLSLRSDSTTSTRSFAFPILQSEWHSSPVRMAKADRRRFRKHGGWRQGLFCCRF